MLAGQIEPTRGSIQGGGEEYDSGHSQDIVNGIKSFGRYFFTFVAQLYARFVAHEKTGSGAEQRFRQLCQLAGVPPKRNVESGEERPWVLKDLRKTCATYYDEHVPTSSVEILGHSVGAITYRHYAHRAPLAFRAILSLPQPSAFTTLAGGFKGRCRVSLRRGPERRKAELHKDEA